MDIDLPLKAQD